MTALHTSVSFKEFVYQTEQQSKISSYLAKYFRAEYNTPQARILDRNITGETINYLTFRKDGTLSFLPKGKELTLNERGEWSREGRQEGKPARAIAQILSPALKRVITNRDLEIFNNLYKGRATELYNIREATGGEIYRIYGMQPNGFTSCMEGASANKLAIYIKNPSVISLLYVEMNQEIRARALCWTDVQGAKIIDRVYGAEEFRTMFRDYAREIGAFKKHYDGAGESAFIAPDGTQVYRSFDIAIVGAFDTYPYIDTFCYYDEKNNILTNEYRKTTLLKLQDTSGGYEDLDGVECMNREERFDEGDTRWSDYHDMHLYYEDAIYINGDYYYEEDGCTEEAIQTGRRRWVLLEECEECEVFNADDYNGLTEQDEISTFTAYKLPNGDIIPQDEATIVNVFVIDGVIMGEVD